MWGVPSTGGNLGIGWSYSAQPSDFVFCILSALPLTAIIIYLYFIIILFYIHCYVYIIQNPVCDNRAGLLFLISNFYLVNSFSDMFLNFFHDIPVFFLLWQLVRLQLVMPQNPHTQTGDGQWPFTSVIISMP